MGWWVSAMAGVESMNAMSSTGHWLVIPCFNEAGRLDAREIDALLEQQDLTILLVDDGSTDATTPLFEELRATHSDRLQTLAMARNVGKGEAVRQGMLRALQIGCASVGYADADFATPSDEILRLHERLLGVDAGVVFGSRLLRPNEGIRRSGGRQFMGATFATLARRLTGMPIADTQCGAKWFRADQTLSDALTKPFHSRWAFDVELLARLRYAPVAPWREQEFIEEPLMRWTEIPGSKLTLMAKLLALLSLLSIWLDVRRLRQARGRAVPQ